MAQQMDIVLGGKDNLSPKIKEAKGSLSELFERIGHTNKELKKSAEENKVAVKSYDKLKQQLKILTNQAIQLETQWRALSDADKNSEFGQKLRQQAESFRQEAGNLKDVIVDVNSEINNIASDTQSWDAAKQGIGILSSSFQSAIGIVGQLGGNTEKFTKALNAMKTVEAATNTVIGIGNALQKQSALMIGLNTAATKLKTVLTKKDIVATELATAAQTRFNLACMANPYVLLVSGVIALGAALYGYIKYTDDAEKEQKKLNDAQAKAKKIQEDLKKSNEELATSGGKAKGQFMMLAAEWKNLATTAQKTKFINDNKSAFDALGLSITNIKTAEDVFVNNTSTVIKALVARAVAAKKAEQAADKLIELEKKRNEKSVASGDFKKRAKAWDKISDEEAKASGVETNVRGELLPKDVEKLNRYREEQARKRKAAREKEIKDESDAVIKDLENSVKKQMDAEKKLAELGDVPITSGKTDQVSKEIEKQKKEYIQSVEQWAKDGTKAEGEAFEKMQKKRSQYFEKAKIEDNTIQAFDAEISALEEAIVHIDVDSEDYQIAKAKIDELKTQKDLIVKPKIPQGSVSDIENQISNLQAKIKVTTDKEEIDKLQNQIEQLEDKKIELLSNPSKTFKEINKDRETLQKRIQDYIDERKQRTKLELQYDINSEVSSVGGKQSQVEKYGKDLDEQITKLTVAQMQLGNAQKEFDKRVAQGLNKDNDLERETYLYDTVQEYKKVKTEYDNLVATINSKALTYDGIVGTVGAIGDLNNAISSVYNSWSSLGEKWNDMSAFEQLTTVIGNIVSTFNTLISTIESIQSLVSIFSNLSAAIETVSAAQVAGKAAEQSANAAAIPTKIAAAEADKIFTATENTAAYASIPFVGPALAAAAMAEYEALWAAAALPFKDGGVVNGATSVGDKVLARLNSGEMVLNNRQQKHLFDLLDNNGYGNSLNNVNGNVEFKIKGKELVGVLNNYQSKMRTF